jgi:hypothetical protein
MDVYQRRRLVALSVLAGVFIIFVLLIRSCGGDDEETPVTPTAGATGLGGATALAADDYINQADTICLETNTALAEVDTSDIEKSSTEQARLIEGQFESLQTLVLAEDAENRDQLENFLGALQEQVAGLDDRAVAAARGDDVTELDVAIDEAATDAKKAARRFGFNVCGDPSEVSGGSGDGETSAEETTSDDTAEVAPETAAPVAPETTPEAVVPEAPATDTGGAVEPTTPPADTGGTDPGTGGISP